jgi:hypothetical protein
VQKKSGRGSFWDILRQQHVSMANSLAMGSFWCVWLRIILDCTSVPVQNARLMGMWL